MQSDGGIAVSSKVGTGTTFSAYFPCVSVNEEASLQPAPRKTELPRGRETVLVVEDDDQVGAVICRLLVSYGYTVMLARSAGAALALLAPEEAKVALVLTDVVMPEIDGRTMANEIVERYPGTKILFMSGYPKHPTVKGADFGPADHFIEKPFTREQMVTAVRRALDERARDSS